MISTAAATLQAQLKEYGKYMQANLDGKTSLIDGSNYTTHAIPEGVATWEWFNIVKLFHTNEGHICSDVLSYYNKDRDALTCPYHLLDVPGPNAEWGVEVKWHSR